MKAEIRLSKILFSIVLLILTQEIAFAQELKKTSLDGIIKDYSTGETLAGANVILINSKDEKKIKGASANSDGFYSVRNISPDTYFLTASFLGYITYKDTVTFIGGVPSTINIELKVDELSLGEVVVQQRAGAAQIELGRQTISSVEVSRVPTPVAGGDLVSYIQVIPGVVSLGNRGGQVFVRGGTPSENMVLVDGALVYKPFHIVSFFSPFPDNLVSSADFYAGGFSAKYNGRASSVLDIRMSNGDRFNYGGSASISPFLVDVLLEGPIKKGKTSLIVSSKHSIIEETSSVYLSEEQPLKFESQFAKLTSFNDDSQCSAMILRTYDRGEISEERNESTEWRNFVVGGNCQSLLKGNLFDFNANLSTLSSRSKHEDRSYLSDIATLNLDINVTRVMDKLTVEAGWFSKVEFISFDLQGKINGLAKLDDKYIKGGAYGRLLIPITSRIELEPSLSFSVFSSETPVSIEPRFRAAFKPESTDAELSAAVGIYRQSVVGVSDQRDATGVFETLMESPVSNKQLEARHALIGWRQTLDNGLTYSMEAYYKDLRNIPVATWNIIAQFSTELALADGNVYGVDARIEYSKDRFYGLIGYGYNKTTYKARGDSDFGVWFGEPLLSYNPTHDRRHQLNSLASIQLGEYSIGIRWQFGSGLPFTQPLGFDEVLFFNQGFPDVNSEVGTSRIIVDEPYKARFISSHNLDLSIERDFKIGTGKSNLNIKAGAINLYNRSNIFYYDIYTQQRVNQLPLTYYISLKVDV